MKSKSTAESISTDLDVSQSMSMDILLSKSGLDTPYESADESLSSIPEKNTESLFDETAYFSAHCFDDSLSNNENDGEEHQSAGFSVQNEQLGDFCNTNEVEIIEEVLTKKKNFLSYCTPCSDAAMNSFTESDVIEFCHSESQVDSSSLLFPSRSNLFSTLQDVDDTTLELQRESTLLISDENDANQDSNDQTEKLKAPNETLTVSSTEVKTSDERQDIEWKVVTAEKEEIEASVFTGKEVRLSEITPDMNDPTSTCVMSQNNGIMFTDALAQKNQQTALDLRDSEITTFNHLVVNHHTDSRIISSDAIVDDERMDSEPPSRTEVTTQRIDESYEIPVSTHKIAEFPVSEFHPIGFADDNFSKEDDKKSARSIFVSGDQEEKAALSKSHQIWGETSDSPIQLDVLETFHPGNTQDLPSVSDTLEISDDITPFPVTSILLSSNDRENEEASNESSDMALKIEQMLQKIDNSLDQALLSKNNSLTEHERIISVQVDFDNAVQTESDLPRINNMISQDATSVLNDTMGNTSEIRQTEDDKHVYQRYANDIVANATVEKNQVDTLSVTSVSEREGEDLDDMEMSLKIDNMLKAIEITRSVHNEKENQADDPVSETTSDDNHADRMTSMKVNETLQKIAEARLLSSMASSEVSEKDNKKTPGSYDNEDSSCGNDSTESLELVEVDDQVAPLLPSTSFSAYESSTSSVDNDVFYSPIKDRQQRKFRGISPKSSSNYHHMPIISSNDGDSSNMLNIGNNDLGTPSSYHLYGKQDEDNDDSSHGNDSTESLELDEIDDQVAPLIRDSDHGLHHASMNNSFYHTPMKDQRKKKWSSADSGRVKPRQVPFISILDNVRNDDDSDTESGSFDVNNVSSSMISSSASFNFEDDSIRRRSLRVEQALRRTSDIENYASTTQFLPSKKNKHAPLIDPKNFESCMFNLDDSDTEESVDETPPPPLEQGFSFFKPIGNFLTSFVSKPKAPVLTEEETFVAKVSNYRMNDLLRLKILGEGQFGQVWLVSDKSRNAFALKLFAKYTLIEAGEVDIILEEAKMHRQIHNHTFIVKLYAIFQDVQMVYMLMQFLQGGELFSVIQKFSEGNEDASVIGMPEDQAKFYAVCIADAIAHMHSLQVAYRDLKPENCMIDSSGYPMLIDFGYAKFVPDKTYTFCGTPRFLPPEAINPGNGYDVTADHWSLGVLIYEMLAGGINPFFEEGMSELALFTAIEEEDYLPLSKVMLSNSSVSVAALSILDGLLTKDPEIRLGWDGTNSILQHEWFSDMNLPDLRKRSVKAPWVPPAKDALDATNFEEWDHLEDKVNQRYPKLTKKQEEKFKSLPF